MRKLLCILMIVCCFSFMSCELLAMFGGGTPKENTPEEIELISAVLKGDAKKVGTIIDSGVSPDTMQLSGTTVLEQAVMGDNADVVDVLLAKGAGLEVTDFYNGCTPVFYCQSAAIFDKLVKAGALLTTVNKEGKTPLMFAIALNAKAKLVKAMIAAGIDVNAQDKGKNTAITVAVLRNDAAMVDVLTAAGGKIQSTDLKLVRDVAMFKSLIAGGAKIEEVPDLGFTYVDLAATTLDAKERAGYIKLVKTLFDKKVIDINLTDSNGETVLFHAVQGLVTDTGSKLLDPIDLLQTVLDYNPDAKILNRNKENVAYVLGKSAYNQACENPVYAEFFAVGGAVADTASSAVSGALGGGLLGGIVGDSLKESANKQFYKIAAEKVTPKAYKALVKVGVSITE